MVLLNPGPVNVSPRVTAALGRGDICHREPECAELLARIRRRLLDAFAPRGFSAVLLTGSGTAAVEAAVTSVCSERGRLVVVSNGVYGERITAMARAARIPVTPVESPWTEAPDLDAVEAALRAPDVEAVAVVHHETTTGVLNPVADIVHAAAGEGRRVLVDAMSSLFGERLDVTQDGIDFVMASANKCLQGVPGISFVLARRQALEALRGRPPRSVYLDLSNHFATQEQDNTPFTPAVQVLHAMRQALRELEKEGVAERIARYAENARVLRRGMAALGFEILVPDGARSSILTTFKLLPGITYDPLHDAMKRRGYIIYAGQGDIRKYAFRVSNMGTLTPADMHGVVEAFAASLAELRAAGSGR